MYELKYFPSNYMEGRKSFLTVANSMGLEVNTYAHPMKGLFGEDLASDVILIGNPEAKKILVTSSATHGAEGMLGSGVQITSLIRGRYKNLADDTAVLIIHAINPWGFSWVRRANEDGVDVFRNFIDFSKEKPENELFDQLADKLVPKRMDFLSSISTNISMAMITARHGMAKLKAQIPTGQYKHEHAPFFGGFRETWSNTTLREILRTYCGKASHVIAIDYHTGLGEFAAGELLGFDKPGDPSYEDAKACWGDDYISVYSRGTTAYEIYGILFNAYLEELPNARMHFSSHEFGTIDESKVFQYMREDHWLHTYGQLDSKVASRVRANMKRAFYCDDESWKNTVLQQAFLAEDQALDFLRAQ